MNKKKTLILAAIIAFAAFMAGCGDFLYENSSSEESMDSSETAPVQSRERPTSSPTKAPTAEREFHTETSRDYPNTNNTNTEIMVTLESTPVPTSTAKPTTKPTQTPTAQKQTQAPTATSAPTNDPVKTQTPEKTQKPSPTPVPPTQTPSATPIPIESLQSFIGVDAEVFFDIFGNPKDSVYGSSMLGLGLEGICYYDDFTVHTYVSNGSEVIIMINERKASPN